MKLVVFDPGVFAAGIFWRHESHRCLKAWWQGTLAPVVTEEILAEYEAVLEQVKRKHRFTTDTGLWLDALRESAVWVKWRRIGKRTCRDIWDEKFIEAALMAQYHTLIVRDRALTVLEKPFGLDIYTPRE